MAVAVNALLTCWHKIGVVVTCNIGLSKVHVLDFEPPKIWTAVSTVQFVDFVFEVAKLALNSYFLFRVIHLHFKLVASNCRYTSFEMQVNMDIKLVQ
jgi:hypothetical protein